MVEINIFSTLKGGSDTGMVLWTDQAGKIIIYDLFRALQTEMGYFNYLKTNRDLQNNIIEPTRKLLFSEFRSVIKEEIEQETPDLENRIENALIRGLEKKIAVLKEYKFSSEDKLNEVTIDQIKEIFCNLREKNINFYRTILEDFKNKKNFYIKELKTLSYSFLS